MLPRRHIRIKVFQSLYTRSQRIEENKFNINKEFKNNLQAYLNLYYFLIDLLILIKEIASEEITIKKRNLIPSKEDLKPNKKFVNNSVLKKLKRKKKKKVNVEYAKIKLIVRNIFYALKKTRKYINYMQTEVPSPEDEKKFIIYILKTYFISSKKIHDYIEEYSIYWNDDIVVVYHLLIEKINNNEQMSDVTIFRQKEDEIFARLLLKETINQEKKISLIIYELVENWDKERIALSDLILMRMAIAELIYIKKIPNKVTLDEYIEISKQYSTPKSKEFINGVLDGFVKNILPKYLVKS